ncbi:response regulator [Mongoliibacter ruber]|uniref:DNA-binding NarL/FixJ family response regulator n=1 Tax=Mongoliibacter ruber TaxID=1750599 RepID=A0A2T0WL76_9BACT|nr:response regulator transcription factor [Mongoliibacter ruber]PRY87412.1 DNA-binding NarL/FixJ family response regulator [Mongoliibacter ruber]
MSTKVLLYEDNDLLKESIVSLVKLNEDMELLGAFGHANDVEEDVKAHMPDLILMDIEMPGRSGIEATKIVKQLYPSTLILILTVFDDSENILNAIKAGASGYLLKKFISTRLFSAVEELLEGGAPMSPTVAKLVIQSMQRTSQVVNYGLTEREKDVLLSLSKGNSFKLIAADCKISIDTVRTHIKHIYEKLQVHCQTEAVSKAINEGLV